MGAVSARFASAGLLHPTGRVMPPAPGVLHEWEGSLSLVDHNGHFAQVKGVDSPSLGIGCGEGALSLQLALPSSIR